VTSMPSFARVPPHVLSRPAAPRSDKGIRLVEQAAEQGHVRARFYLATCYDFGRGPARTFGSPCGGTSRPPSPDTRWRNTIWRWGLRDGVGIRRNLRAAVRWFRSAARPVIRRRRAIWDGASRRRGCAQNLREQRSGTIARRWAAYCAPSSILDSVTGMARASLETRPKPVIGSGRQHVEVYGRERTAQDSTPSNQGVAGDDHLPRSPRSVARR